jgi:predicted ribosomally synthesized peptide with SipW-like signal peptide
MLKKLKFLFFPAAIIFIASAFTGAYFSDSVSVSGNSVSAGTWVTATSTDTPTLTPTETPVETPTDTPTSTPGGASD